MAIASVVRPPEVFHVFKSRRRLSAIKMRTNSPENPRISHSAAPNHQRVASRLFQHLQCQGNRYDVAVADHRNAERLLRELNEAPVRMTAVALGFCSRMDRNKRCTGLLRREQILLKQRCILEPRAHLDRHRRIPRPHHRLHRIIHKTWLLQQARSRALPRHSLRGAPAV